MNDLLTSISESAKTTPNKTALVGSDSQLSYAELICAVEKTAQCLKTQCHGVIALAMDNSPAWVVIDLACQLNQVPLVALPPFYTQDQCRHVLEDARVQWLLTDSPERFFANRNHLALEISGHPVTAIQISDGQDIANLKALAKITYTSGTTGQPKGVCLSEKSLLAVSQSMVKRVQASTDEVHLALTPLAVLLENIASVHACLSAGGTSCIPSLAETGLSGSSSLEVAKLLVCLERYQATSAIMMPYMLKAMVCACEKGANVPGSLRFLSVGGAVVSSSVLRRAQDCAIPVYQGYGLSECASVVALNSVAENRVGSVGKVLPHLEIKISKNSEIWIKGTLFEGYINQDRSHGEFFATGDLGFVDEDGYLFIQGRKKNQFITAFGRNVSPEWIEDELTASDIIHHAFVYGEARAWNSAIVFSSVLEKEERADHLAQSIEQTNRHLPDYARIKTWIDAGNSEAINQLSMRHSGTVSREQVFKVYQNQLDALYETEYQ